MFSAEQIENLNVKGDKIEPVPLGEVAGKLKYVPADCDEIKNARAMGVSFGDE